MHVSCKTPRSKAECLILLAVAIEGWHAQPGCYPASRAIGEHTWTAIAQVEADSIAIGTSDSIPGYVGTISGMRASSQLIKMRDRESREGREKCAYILTHPCENLL